MKVDDSFWGSFKRKLFILLVRVNSPNSGCLLNIGNGPHSGPPMYSMAKAREAAHQFIMGPKAESGP